jgi:hypothetical protein
MDKYAVLYAEVADRRDEVTNEEFWLYFLIVLHSYVRKDGVRICEITNMRKFCKMHDLQYNNTQRRLMRLRTGTFAKKEPVKKVAQMKTPWIYKTNSGDFLPLVGIKEIVKNTIFMKEEIVKNTNSNCKKYKKSTEKIVKNTTSFKKDLNNSLNNLLNKPAAEENSAAAAAEIITKSSKFSEEECLRYAQICKEKGERIEKVNAFARYLYLTGDQDVYIQAELYPDPTEDTPTGEPETDDFVIEVEPMSESARHNTLVIYRGIARDSGLEALDSMKDFHTPEDWQWLMTELAK